MLERRLALIIKQATLAFHTPILLLVFNRPDETQRLFDVLQKLEPSKIYIAADGPRQDILGETNQCEKVKSIFEKIEWDCELRTLYREENLGCGLAVSSAISWFFEEVDRGIILEDDIIPDISFFRFCEICLQKYMSNKNIFQINGFSWEKVNTESSYSYSRYPVIWGWATWRDRWAKYSYVIRDLDKFKKSKKLNKITSNPLERRLHYWAFRRIEEGFDTWDFQWFYTVFNEQGLCISPRLNLVTNIGDGLTAKHTKETAFFHHRESHSIEFPLIAPFKQHVNRKIDKYHARMSYFNGLSPMKYVAKKLLMLVKERITL